MKELWSFETSGNYYPVMQCHIQEDSNHQSHCCDNTKAHKL